MAPRANWKGFLRLSLVTCPVALFPATSESEKISFNQINKTTGHRIRYLKVDAETGEEVSNEDIIKGYQVDKDRYLEVTKDELENISLESTRTIEIDEFVPRSEIDDLYLVRPYYIVPDGKVGHDAFAVIRETIRSLDKVALARIVLTNREHVIALEARDKGLMGMLLRYPYEVRDASEYFDDIQDVKNHQGHARSGKAHRRAEERPFRAGEIRRPLRGGARRAACQEAERSADCSSEEACGRQRHQSDGCAAPEPRLVWKDYAGGKAG
jgi:Ku protein